MSANTETTGADRTKCAKWCGKRSLDSAVPAGGGMNGPVTFVRGDMYDSARIAYCSQSCRDARLPPVAAPAAHVERRKGQVWKCAPDGPAFTLSFRVDERKEGAREIWEDAEGQRWVGWDITGCMTLLADAPPEPAKPCESCGGNESTCGVHGCPGGKIKTCPTCEWAMSDCVCAPPEVCAAYRCHCGKVDGGHYTDACGKTVAPAQEAPKAAPVCCSKCGSSGETNFYMYDCRTTLLCVPCQDVTTKWIKGQAGKPYAGPERLPRPQLAADWVEDCLPEAGR